MTSPSAVDTRTAALAALRELVGRPDADFHDGQYEAIEALVEGRRRALVVQRTAVSYTHLTLPTILLV